MRLSIQCMKCFQGLGRPSGEFSQVEFCDDGRYKITCSQGHETVTLLQEQKFEVLFDIGANAILGGYYRGAVSSFTSSLERFYEFAIRVLLERVGVSDEIIKNIWKKVSNSSERQLGAFIFIWAFCFKEDPETLSEKEAKFRNDVIHKGKIPTRDEAIWYGKVVLNIIRPKMRLLQQQFPNKVLKVISKHLSSVRKEDDVNKQFSTMGVWTIINLARCQTKHNTMTLEEGLDCIKEWHTLEE